MVARIIRLASHVPLCQRFLARPLAVADRDRASTCTVIANIRFKALTIVFGLFSSIYHHPSRSRYLAGPNHPISFIGRTTSCLPKTLSSDDQEFRLSAPQLAKATWTANIPVELLHRNTVNEPLSSRSLHRSVNLEVPPAPVSSLEVGSRLLPAPSRKEAEQICR